MSAAPPGPLSAGQEQALRSLDWIARRSRGALTVDLNHDRQPGVLYARVYLSSASLASSEQGVRLEEWEPIDIQIYDDFPDTPPIASAGHDNFLELPHQPRGSAFCVRVTPNNWNPSAGMLGFMRAVIGVYQRIALGALEGHLQPWRPPAGYPEEGCVVVRADRPAAGRTGPGTVLRWAAGTRTDGDRTDIVEWLDFSDADGSAEDLAQVLGRELMWIRTRAPDAFLVPAVIISKPIALEYFDSWLELLTRIKEQGVDREQILAHVACAMSVNRTAGRQRQPGPGNPSEGEEAHGEEKPGIVLFRVTADTPAAQADSAARFAAARLAPTDVDIILRVCSELGNDKSQKQLREEFLARVPVSWVQVYDGRPESVLRRATGRPVEKLAGTRILVLGCGALGAPIAEHCVRAGAARVHLVDSAAVNPGILVRQPYEDADIGKRKSDVLAGRLRRIRPDTEVTASAADIVSAEILEAAHLAQYDLVIDATANRSVAAKIERSQRDTRDGWPTLVTVAISQRATRGVAAVTPRGTVGAGIDLLRRLGLETYADSALRDVYTEFFPPPAKRLSFRPEPGCSDATFIGSTTDVSALAAQLLDSALIRVGPLPGAAGTRPAQRSLSIVRVGCGDEQKPGRVVFDLPEDRAVMDHGQGYEVRLTESAMGFIRACVRASADGTLPGAGHTGGLLLGQFDDSCRIAWVSEATGLPPGSTADPLRVSLDAPDVRDALTDRDSSSAGMLRLIGFWHTHPGGPVTPSDIDQETMQALVGGPDWHSAMMLLLVLGVPEDGSVGEPPSPWTPDIHAEVFTT